MSPSVLTELPQAEEPFRHVAFFYAGEAQFLEGTTAFIRDAVGADEPVLVVVSARKIDLLRDRLASDGARVRFADMADVGLNPARIIPAWAEFLLEHEEGPVRGIGEPIWAERGPDELVECQQHESLLNVAFAANAGFTLLCPYDTSGLGPDVLDEASRSHPFIQTRHTNSASARYPGVDRVADLGASPLPEPPTSALSTSFQAGSLGEVRALVRRGALRAGLSEPRSADAVIAVNEAASNSLCHGGGSGSLRLWHTADTFICEVSDAGHIDDPLVGRVRPDDGAEAGRGVWMVNQSCDLAQVRTSPLGTSVRMHFRRQPRA